MKRKNDTSRNARRANQPCIVPAPLVHFDKVMPNRIKEYRTKRYWSQQALAKKCGVSRETISYWEQMHKGPTDKHKAMLCAIFGCQISDLFDWR